MFFRAWNQTSHLSRFANFTSNRSVHGWRIVWIKHQKRSAGVIVRKMTSRPNLCSWTKNQKQEFVQRHPSRLKPQQILPRLSFAETVRFSVPVSYFHFIARLSNSRESNQKIWRNWDVVSLHVFIYSLFTEHFQLNWTATNCFCFSKKKIPTKCNCKETFLQTSASKIDANANSFAIFSWWHFQGGAHVAVLGLGGRPWGEEGRTARIFVHESKFLFMSRALKLQTHIRVVE